MKYAAPSQPHIDNLTWLVHLARPFPTSARIMQQLAGKWGFDKHVRELIGSFPEDEEFESGEDFLTRCEELEFLAREESDMPAETLRSPQD